jgi:ribonuclease-3
VPEYVVEESGPDHQKSFRARVRVGQELYGDGRGHSKKEAEQQAAATAYAELQVLTADTAAADPDAASAASLD